MCLPAGRVIGSFAAAWMLLALLPDGVAPQARGDGFIIIERPLMPEVILPPRPRPVPRIAYMPMHVKYHHVDAEITDNAAVTRIDQSFHNPNPQQMEGTYIFPLPDDVAVQRFSMFMDGKEVQGEVLDKDKARQIYEDIVRKMRDPALLEYVGTKMYRARVFPIPAQGEVRIKLDYSQLVPVAAGLATYRYPLNTEKFSSAPLGELSVRVRIKSQIPLTTVFCPSHDASIDRRGDREATVGYEARNVLPDKDFIVGYQMSDKEFGLALLTQREGGEDGFFMARLSPSAKVSPDRVMSKDICFVIDTSGSMSGKKIDQARQALRFCLDNLNREDRFNLVSFSTEARAFRDELIPATKENITDAREHAGQLKAAGGTSINDALLAALEQGRKARDTGKRPYMIVFLTDGRPTVGQTDIPKILEAVKNANPGNVRLFVFGVGSDVNTHLLDKLAEDNHGARQYVSEDEDLEVKLSGFYTMIDSPVLSDLKLEFGGAGAYDVYPKVLPDLFKGTELVVFGRYKEAGRHPVSLRGQQGDTAAHFTWEQEFPRRETGHDYLARLWASRKVGYLLDQIRLHGEDKELKTEIVDLAKRYGIVTPYTSFLIVEEDKMKLAQGVPVEAPALSFSLSKAAASPGAGSARLGEARKSFYSADGAAAVAGSKELLQQQVEVSSAEHLDLAHRRAFARITGAEPAGEPTAGGAATETIRFAGSRAFYRDGDKWVDSGYRQGDATIKVTLFSEDYFRLIADRPEAAKCFALGPQVLVILDGKAYETVEQ